MDHPALHHIIPTSVKQHTWSKGMKVQPHVFPCSQHELGLCSSPIGRTHGMHNLTDGHGWDVGGTSRQAGHRLPADGLKRQPCTHGWTWRGAGEPQSRWATEERWPSRYFRKRLTEALGNSWEKLDLLPESMSCYPQLWRMQFMCLFTNTSTLFRAPGGSRSSAESVSIPHQGKYCVKVFPHTGTGVTEAGLSFFFFSFSSLYLDWSKHLELYAWCVRGDQGSEDEEEVQKSSWES